jgi:TonB family protein
VEVAATRRAAWLLCGLALTGCLSTDANQWTAPGWPPGFPPEGIRIDSTDGRYAVYLDDVRERIMRLWPYPCVPSGSNCEYRPAVVDIEFGVLQSGTLQFVNVIRSSGMTIYDDSAVNATRRASPYPPIPSTIMALLKPGSRGLVINARFKYTVETGGDGAKP